MSLKPYNYNSSSIILYSSLFIVTCELLLAKVSFQIFSVFSPLPFLFIGLCIRFKDFFLSVLFALFQIILINYFFPEYLLNKQIIFFHFSISTLALIFFYSCNLELKFKFNSSNLISGLILFFVSLLAIFYFIFFNSFEQEEFKSFFKEIVTNIYNIYNIQEKNNIDDLVNILISILPSINSLIFFITFSFNLIFAKFLLKKIEIFQNLQPDFETSSTPTWYSVFYLSMVLSSLLFDSSSNFWIFSINAMICMSFSYLLDGYKAFNNFFKNINLDRNLKFIIIFLLFIFLGYVLLLIILILGYLENFKKLKRKK